MKLVTGEEIRQIQSERHFAKQLHQTSKNQHREKHRKARNKFKHKRPQPNPLHDHRSYTKLKERSYERDLEDNWRT